MTSCFLVTHERTRVRTHTHTHNTQAEDQIQDVGGRLKDMEEMQGPAKVHPSHTTLHEQEVFGLRLLLV